MPGSLAIAVTDSLRGAPAKGMLVDLFRLDGGERHHLRTVETDAPSGATPPLLEGEALTAASYELLFHVGRYFKAQRATLDGAPFVDVIPVRFAVADANRITRVSLVATPWSYTVFRE